MSKSCEVPECERMWSDHFKGFMVCSSHLDPVIDWVRETAGPAASLDRQVVADIVQRRAKGTATAGTPALRMHRSY